MTKTCSRCKEKKSFSEFPKDKHRPDGYGVYCKFCRGKMYREKKDRGFTAICKRSKAYLHGKLFGLNFAREQFKEQNFDMVMIQNSFNFYKSIDSEIQSIQIELETKKKKK